MLVEVAHDDSFSEVVVQQITDAHPDHHHSVHVEFGGLEPATSYWYRFLVGDWTSPVGRTRTAPAPGSRPESVRLAVASCQAFMSGYYGAHRHLAREELDAVVFVDDYIYEREAGSFATASLRRCRSRSSSIATCTRCTSSTPSCR